MKTVSGAMQAHLAGGLTTLATCWLITRKDAKVFAFTDLDRDLVVSGVTYKSALSYSRSAIRTTSDMSVDSLDVQGVLDSTEITESDLEAGLFDNAAIQIFAVNYNDLSMGIIKLRSGWIGKVTGGQNRYSAELRGLALAMQTVIGDVYQPSCRNDLGDSHCGVVLGPFTDAGSVSSVTDQRTIVVSGLAGAGPVTTSYTASTIGFFPNYLYDSAAGFLSAGFAALDAVKISGSAFNNITVQAQVVTASQLTVADQVLTRERAGNPVTLTVTVAGYYDGGILTFTSGLNNGIAREVRTWVPNTITLYLPMPFTIASGDTFSIVAGCDKRLNTCIKKFNNLLGPDGLNGGFRGEPFVPGQDQVLSYANTKS